MAAPAGLIPEYVAWELLPVAAYADLRVLAWDGPLLYASRGYELLRAQFQGSEIMWSQVARYRAPYWRCVTAKSNLTFRLFRDGLHALAVLSSGHLVAAVPGAIATLLPGENQFRVSHKLLRGTRPLHITAIPHGQVFWGEYFDNPGREQVHIYVSLDQGMSWEVAHSFPRHSVRHVHNIVYDEWQNCLWVLTGDHGAECRIVRATCDFSSLETVISGDQQARAAAILPTEEGLYLSSDTPFEQNHIYRLDRQGKLEALTALPGSSIYGCQVQEGFFFSTMVEPSKKNGDRCVRIFGSLDGIHWRGVLEWRKDLYPMRLFQYGNAFLPDGKNQTDLLAVTTLGVKQRDLQTSLWRLSRAL
jgi:hypothetical protein